MKVLLVFTFFIAVSCNKNASKKERFSTVYIAGCDSVFCCESETFDAETLSGSKKNDSTFINKKLEEFQKNNKEIYIKVFGTCGGIAGITEDFTHLFDRKNIKWKIVEPDSLEENYFHDESFFRAVQQLKIELNEPKVEDIPNSKPFFQFILKTNGAVYYSYDSTDMNRNLTLINNPTKEKLVQALNNAEAQHNIKLGDDQIMIRGDASARYPDFKVIKDALKAKDIFRFKIVTNGPASPKATEKETPVLITAKTLTLLLAANDDIFYFHGTDCSNLQKTTVAQLKTLFKNEKSNMSAKDILIVIKQEEGGSFKMAVDILDEINLSKISADHFAETEITASEINCIKNYKTK